MEWGVEDEWAREVVGADHRVTVRTTTYTLFTHNHSRKFAKPLCNYDVYEFTYNHVTT